MSAYKTGAWYRFDGAFGVDEWTSPAYAAEKAKLDAASDDRDQSSSSSTVPKVSFHPVERPAHYASGAVECIDAIESALSPDGFIGFLRGQVIKYQWRMGQKGDPAEDAAKARWYATRLETFLKRRSESRA